MFLLEMSRTMKLINNALICLKMILKNYGFYICVLFTFILCLCTGIYRDPINNNEYSVIKVLKSFDHNYMLNDRMLCSYMVAERGAGSWLSMFIPIISAFASIPLICDEKEAGFIRLSIFRSSKYSYYASKFLTSCIAGGLAVMLGYLFYTISVYFLFPNINEYPPEIQEMLNEELSNMYPEASKRGYIALHAIKFFEMFIFGMVASVPAVSLTCFMRNKYLIMCIPFFYKYAVTQGSERLMSAAFKDISDPNEKLAKLAGTLSPDATLNVFSSANMRQILLYNGILVLIAFTIYILVSERRFDCGE